MHLAARSGLQRSQRHSLFARLCNTTTPAPSSSCRSFHRGPLLAYPRFPPRSSNPPNSAASFPKDADSSFAQPQGQHAEAVSVEALGPPSANGSTAGAGATPRSRSHVHTSSRRSSSGPTSRRQDGIPPFVLPERFLNDNVSLHEEAPAEKEKILRISFQSGVDLPPELQALLEGPVFSNADSTSGITQNKTEDHETPSEPSVEQKREALKAGISPTDDVPGYYELHHTQWVEVASSVAAALNAPRNTVGPGSFTAEKAHLRLHCPVNGSTYFLESIVENIAKCLKADVVRIDGQDLAAFAHDYIQEGPDAHSNALWTLGYDMQQSFKKSAFGMAHEVEESDEAAEEEDFDEDDRDGATPKLPPHLKGVHAIPIASINVPGGLGGVRQAMESIRDAFQQARTGQSGRMIGSPQNQSGVVAYGQNMNNEERWNDLKLNHMLQSLLEANVTKRRSSLGTKATDAETDIDDAVGNTSEQPKTVLLIRDIKEMAMSGRGPTILEKLTDKVKEMRRQGHQIVIIGITASADMLPDLSTDGIRAVQSEWPHSVGRTVVITPDKAGPNKAVFYFDEQRRTREINIRNLIETVQRLDGGSQQSMAIDAGKVESDIRQFHPEYLFYLDNEPLAFYDVHRIALVALGLRNIMLEGENGADRPMGAGDFVKSLQTLEQSDNKKAKWVHKERALQSRPEKEVAVEEDEKSTLRKESEARLSKLRKECNRYEKRLLGGVVNTADLKTTFGQVHAPPTTVEALKTLTMLSLSRPDAFSYGVLATDKISGLLLYGPPGTGKTLLAKAVAKESGATVLEVSGSDVYNMYVGEGEKNVKAIFSLAKKLSPCVVFIDEADAIFASRGGHHRNSHRELINQFLREWDGMTETNAFIMVATNRPFDLDDAVLRRLPRRLLVDLPVEKDREAILGIHLRDEVLDKSVSLPTLASQTSLYSGSDLKNVAVAAALAAVKEETEEARKAHEISASDDKDGEAAKKTEIKYPERRILHQRHFDSALQEISASINEDMRSLAAIRKFDERYGDRRGRKKKPGFGYGSDLHGEKDTVKVRG